MLGTQSRRISTGSEIRLPHSASGDEHSQNAELVHRDTSINLLPIASYAPKVTFEEESKAGFDTRKNGYGNIPTNVWHGITYDLGPHDYRPPTVACWKGQLDLSIISGNTRNDMYR